MISLPQALERIASLHPDGVPFRSSEGTPLTYSSWLRRTKALRAVLTAETDIRLGDRVLLLCDQERWHEYPIMYIAALSIGATVVTLRPEDVTSEETTSVNTTFALACGTEAEHAASRAGQYLTLGSDDYCRDELSILPSPAPEMLAEIVFTSGTTGRRMAVGCSHANLSSMLDQRIDSPIFGFAESSVLVHHIPLGTLAAQRVILEGLRSPGQTSICVPRPTGEKLAQVIEGFSAKFVGLVPATARRLISHMAKSDRKLNSVRWVSVGSSNVDTATFSELAEIFPRAQLLNMYGLTEAGAARIRSVYTERPGSIGRPEPGTRICIRDERGQDLPSGSVGELWLSQDAGPGRFYVDDAEATSFVFRDGWVRTGDLARVDEDGYVHLIDRVKDVMVSAGEKVGSFPIEQYLLCHQGVKEAAVFGVPTSLLGERIVAAVVIDASVLLPVNAKRELLEFCRDGLPPRQVPTRFVIVDQLPTGATGKVLKRKLRDMCGRR